MMFSDEEVLRTVVQADPDDNPQDFQLQFSIYSSQSAKLRISGQPNPTIDDLRVP
jgi:hypothetical protein